MSPGLVMERRAARTAAERRPDGRTRSPAPPPANDNRAPGILVALTVVAAALVILGGLAWLLMF